MKCERLSFGRAVWGCTGAVILMSQMERSIALTLLSISFAGNPAYGPEVKVLAPERLKMDIGRRIGEAGKRYRERNFTD